MNGQKMKIFIQYHKRKGRKTGKINVTSDRLGCVRTHAFLKKIQINCISTEFRVCMRVCVCVRMDILRHFMKSH